MGDGEEERGGVIRGCEEAVRGQQEGDGKRERVRKAYHKSMARAVAKIMSGHKLEGLGSGEGEERLGVQTG